MQLQPLNRRSQSGLTLIGTLVILAMIGALAYAGLRLAPLYLNYMKVARSLDATAQEFKSDNPDPGGIRKSLEKHWQIEDISAITPKEVEVVKNESGVALHVVYDDSAPYLGNVSLTVHFDKTSKVQ